MADQLATGAGAGGPSKGPPGAEIERPYRLDGYPPQIFYCPISLSHITRSVIGIAGQYHSLGDFGG